MSSNDSQNLTEEPNQPDDPSRAALHVHDVIVFDPEDKGHKQVGDPYRVDCVTYALVIVFVAGIVIVVLALLGPAVGNVFSTIGTGI